MANDIKNWNRIGYVSIEGRDGEMKNYYDLDFKFSVNAIPGMYTEFSVSVLGLSISTINELTVWSDLEAVRRMRRIEVYAGYEDTGIGVVASGYIWYAMPTKPPEMWMEFKCKQFMNHELMVKAPRELVNKPLKEIFANIAGECGYASDYRASGGDAIIKSYVIEGKIGDLARNFGKTFNKNVFNHITRMICIDRHEEKREPRKQVIVNQYNGLLAVGNIDMLGATIVTRLRTDIGLFDWIDMESILIPSSSGKYIVNAVESEGHLRGDKWETRYKCLRDSK